MFVGIEIGFVAVYGDLLEHRESIPELENLIPKNLPDLPDRVFQEDEACKEVAEFCVVVANGEATLQPWGMADGAIASESTGKRTVTQKDSKNG